MNIFNKTLAILGMLLVLSPSFALADYATQSANLSGSSQYFSRADNSLLEPGAAFTVECWAKFSDIVGAGAKTYIIASKGTSTGNQRTFVWKVSNDGSNNITLSTQTSSAGSGYDGGTSVSWSSAPSNGTWYHISWSVNGSTEQYSVDDAQMGANQTSAISSLFDGTGAAGFGAENISGTPGTFFKGQLSLCRMWQTTRSVAQISAAKCSLLGATANLSGEWSLDNVLTDNSGNALTLTNNGSITFTSDVPSCVSASSAGETVFQLIES